jgi:hypothetical protein
MSSSLSRSGVWLLCLLLFSGVALLGVAGCKTSAPSPPPAVPSVTSSVPVTPIAAAPEFVGNDACRACHAEEFRNHVATRHQMTLRPATRAALGKLAPPNSSKLPDSRCVVEAVEDGYRVRVPEQPENAEKLHFVLGSGKTGMTFISVMNSRTVFEMRGSYFPRSRTWYLTPGQRGVYPDDLGVDHVDDVAEKCIGCHVVTTDPVNLTPDPKFFGVGCESCHGAGSVHVAAMQAGEKTSHMENWGNVGATKLNEMCGKCHRTAEEVSKLKPNPAHTARFQPYGLMKSACFLKSGDTLSCLSCHDPHKDASTDARAYEQKCLSCHAGNRKQGTEDRKQGTGNRGQINSNDPMTQRPNDLKPCPVNPKSGCIPCHMPKRRVLPTSDVGTMMSDHHIRVFRPDELKALRQTLRESTTAQ